MSLMQGMRSRAATYADGIGNLDGYDKSAPQTEDTRDLLQLFSGELRHCPRLDREEAYALACHTHAAWRCLLAALQEQQTLLSTLTDKQQAYILHESLSEQEIVRLIQRVRTHLNQTKRPKNAAYTSVLSLWCEQVRERLDRFRAYRDEMVRRNLRLVVLLARRYQGRGLGLLDLIQEGALGLMRAIEKFDPERQVAFSSYAVWWIRQAFLRALVHKEESASSSRQEAPHLSIQLVSLDTPLKEDAKESLADLIASPEESSPEDVVLNAEESQQLHRALTRIPPQEANILRLRFGLVGGNLLTYAAIGQRLGLSREQVRLREQRALMRLKKQLQYETKATASPRSLTQPPPTIPVTVPLGRLSQCQEAVSQ